MFIEINIFIPFDVFVWTANILLKRSWLNTW